jgi:cytochrome P450
MLRYDPPIQLVTRIAAVDTELEGVPLQAGAALMLFNGAANRDQRVFPDADRFDITRSSRDHLSFAFGPHFCLGAPIARAELRIFFETLIRRFPDVELAVPREQLARNPHRGLRGLVSLPLRLGRDRGRAAAR